MNTDGIFTYEVACDVPHVGRLFVTVASFQGQDAAVRRVKWSLVSLHRELDITPDDIEIVSVASRAGLHVE